ncbi:MAG: hypothetical protein R3B90_19285 [Planctomycetaceae bacterium]
MLQLTHQRFGPLDCSVVRDRDSEQPPELACVLCHGFGAGGADLVPLAGEYCRLEPALAARVAFVFPAAPLEPAEFRGYGGRAWWPLAMARLQAAIETGAMRNLREEEPPRLPTARRELGELIEAVQTKWNLPISKIVLGGFSQGAMLTTDVALHLPQTPAGLVIYSGNLLSERDWTEHIGQAHGLRVLQSHGVQDPILPFSGAESLRQLLERGGAEVEFLRFNGPHTIPAEAVALTATRLAAALTE